jgi:trimethylamine--corrinoid protein Co-methyltransferase
MKLGFLEVLSSSDIREIHEASLDILAGCGVKILSPRMLEFLKGKGLKTDTAGQLVYFSPTNVEDALASIPPRFEVFDREGRPAFSLGGGESRIAAGHNAVNWVDSDTGETRFSRVADVETFARLCQRLEAIDMIGIPVMPQDVPDPAASLLYGVRAVIENSTKPVYFSTDSARVNNAIIELLRAAFAGNLKERVYGIAQFSPTSPLYWEEGVLEAFLDMAGSGVPIAVLPEPIAGVSAPYTLAGLLTMDNAECLSGLAMIQLLSPGSPVLYANSWTASNMQNGAALVGSTETTICRIAGAQLARFYKCPSHTTAPNSDNHAHDEQNAWEKTLSTFCSVGAGNDLIVNCGMFATGLTCSHEQLLMDEAISAFSRRISQGLLVNRDTVAAELIKERGPRGETYLTADHTLKWLRSSEYVRPRLSVTGSFGLWKEAGAKDTYALAREEAKRLAAEAPQPFDPRRRARLAEIIAGFRRR